MLIKCLYTMESLQFFNIDTEHIETISTLCNNKFLVIDFWHTKCTKCPLALEKLDEMSNNYSNVNFVSCALSLAENDLDVVKDISEDNWDNLMKLYLTIDGKEKAKELFGFKAVPFCVVFSTDGSLIASDDPKNINFDSLFKSFETDEDF